MFIPRQRARRQLQNANDTAQDFEGQRLAELLATIVLAVVGVRVSGSLMVVFTNYILIGYRVCYWIRPPRYHSSTLCWTRRHRPRVRPRRSAVALFQPEPRSVATSGRCSGSGLTTGARRYRGGWEACHDLMDCAWGVNGTGL